MLEELPRYVTTDARGRFRFDSVPAGLFTITFLHPSLDSLDIAAEHRSVAARQAYLVQMRITPQEPPPRIVLYCSGTVAEPV